MDGRELVSIPRHSRSALVLGSMCAFVTSLNQSIMSVAFPDLRRSFPDASAAQLSWVLNSYTIVAGATLIPAAVVSGRFGRKRVLLTGLTVFTLAAAVCTFAPHPSVLISARVVQALGWAMITPSAIAVILADMPMERRATAIATWGGVGGVATSLAPSLGAFIIDLGSWRWAFAVSIPFSLLVIAIGSRVFRESQPHELVRTGLPDPIGAASLMVGVTLVILGLVESPTWGWGDSRTLACIGVGVALLALLFRRSGRVRNPMLDRRVLGYRNMRLAATLSVAYGTGFFASNLGLVLFLTEVWGHSVVRAGIMVTPMAACVTLLAPIAGRMGDRFGHRVLTIPAGISWTLGALWLLLHADGRPALWSVWCPAVVLLGIGSGLGWPTIHALPVIGVPPAEVSTATATNQTVLRTAGALGVAIAITLVSSGADVSIEPFQRLFVLMAVSGVLLASIGSLVRTGPVVHRRAATATARDRA